MAQPFATSTNPDRKITEITRRDLFDAFLFEKINWSGRLSESTFLSRLYDLSKLPSFDSRHRDAAGDIAQHREFNHDWDDDWVLRDRRFALERGPDETLLRFLCETLHPAVQPDADLAASMCGVYNRFLQNDGYKIVEMMRISGKPVYAAHYVGVGVVPAVDLAKLTLSAIDPGYVSQQITRMEAAVGTDPALAIGTAKELVESCCRTILVDRNVDVPKGADFPDLVKLTIKALELAPNDISDQVRAADTVKRLLNNLATIAQGLAELRNNYGTGHGKAAGTRGLGSRHAKLAVGAASTLAVFLVETHNERPSLTGSRST
jgi:hypothetical protein